MSDVRPYTYSQATAEQMQQQKVLTDSQQNGVKTATSLQVLQQGLKENNFPAAQTLSGISIVGVDASGNGKKVDPSSFAEKVSLLSVDTSEWTGSVNHTATLGAMTDYGTLPVGVTGIAISFPSASGNNLAEGAVQFTLPTGTTFASLSVSYNSVACKKCNFPDEFEAGKTYQVSMCNGCAVVGIFETEST